MTINPLDYLRIPSGQSPSTPPLSTSEPILPDIDASNGLIRYSPEWQRFKDQQEMALAGRAAGITNATIENPTGTPTSTPTTSASMGGGIPDAPPPPSGDNISAQTKDAFAIMQDALKSWGLESLGKNFQTLMVQGYTANEALIKIKTDKAYNAEYVARFAGNFQRQDKGLNVMSEAAYLELEDSMENSLVNRGYGNILSVNPETRRQQKAGWIGNNWNATDFDAALKTIEERVDTQDPAILAKMQQYYPGLQKKDLVTYLLDPTNKETMASINKKVTAGEIGAALSGQGLMEDVNRVQGLVNAGVSGATALAEAKNIKEVLPYSQDLTNVYKEAGIVYNQDTAEQEFFKGNVDAQKKRNQLKSLQRASFQADPGMGKGALSSPISI